MGYGQAPPPQFCVQKHDCISVCFQYKPHDLAYKSRENAAAVCNSSPDLVSSLIHDFERIALADNPRLVHFAGAQ